MAMKAGIWLDHKQAVLVLITDEGRQVKKIKSGVGMPTRTAGGSRPQNRYAPHDFVAEDRLERKRLTHLSDFYDEVIARLRGAEALLILGPGEAKSEFLKRLKSKKVGSVVEMAAADKMSDRQVAARVSEHFGEPSSSQKTNTKTDGARPAMTSRDR
jgi:peptide subunit release factor 1 (eRF1)